MLKTHSLFVTTAGLLAVLTAASGEPAARAQCVDPPAGVAAWWSFDDVGGAVLENVDPGVPDGAVFGAPSPVPTEEGMALAFDGIDDYVEVPSHPAFDLGTGDFSIVGWIRTEDAGATATSILGRREHAAGPGNVYRGYNLYLYRGRLGVQLADGHAVGGRTYTNFNSEATVADGAWHPFAVTVDRDASRGIRWYVDGRQLGRTFDPRGRQSSLTSSSPLRIGVRAVSMDGWFRGALDQLMVFHRALTPQEVAILARLGTGGACKTAAAIDCKIEEYPAALTVGEKATFQGAVDDDDFGDCGYLPQWTSDRDGSLGPGLSRAPTLTAGRHEVCLLVSGISGDCKGKICQSCVGVTVEKRPVDPPVPAGTWCGKDHHWWTEEIATGRRGYRNAMATTATEIHGDEEDLPELILGNAQANEIDGKGGDDCIYGFGGNDRLHGDRTGIPAVTGSGGSGDDEIHGGDGDDSIWGDASADRLYGGAGADRVKGDSGRDSISGGPGNDFVMGDAARDRLQGDAGDDRLCGNSGRDSLNGGVGTDACRQGSGRKESQTACETKLRRKDCTAKAWNRWQPEQGNVASCPKPRKKVGEWHGMPVCKAWPHSAIKKKRCAKKGGALWTDYCVWNRGSWYRARKLR